MKPRVYVNGQESRSAFDEQAGIITIVYENLQGEPIPPLPDKPKEESYSIQISYEIEFVNHE